MSKGVFDFEISAKVTGTFPEIYVTQLESHDCAVFKARAVML